MRSAAFLAVGILLIVAQGNLYPVLGYFGLHGATPSFVLPLIIFLGVHETSMARGSLLAVTLGYATDLLASAPIGLFSLMAVALWWLGRIAGVRLTAQTWWTKAALAFGSDPQRPLEIASVALPHATSTAICSLLIFPLAQRIHQGAALSRAFEGLGR
jgi:rod shape-determining protein MreD